MLEDYFEDFILMENTESADALGDSADSWQETQTFRGGLTHTPGAETDALGRPTLRAVPTLMHEWDVTLRPGDRVRRMSDGTVYRVTGLSDTQRAPAFSALCCAQVLVERLVTQP